MEAQGWGVGVFTSQCNGDRMDVSEGRVMSIYNRETRACVAQVEIAPDCASRGGAFDGRFPWGVVEMRWDGACWKETGTGVVWSPGEG